MKKTASLIQILVFLLFIGVLCVLHLALPDKSFSQQENRPLQTIPSFSWNALRSGKYTASLESYVSDQFPFRDGWTAMKARAELAVGKDENNGVFLCEGETLLECYTAPEEKELETRVGYVNALAERFDGPVYFALVPSSGEIWRDKLPAGAPNDSQREVIDAAYALAKVPTVDLCGALGAHKAEPVYYRTDHHWTTLGAWYGYAALGETMGYAPVPLSDYAETVVTEEFYGTTYSSSGFSWVAPDRIVTYVEQGGAIVTNYPQGAPETGSLYHPEALEGKDKYTYFYGGNTPLLTVETGTPGPKLLILRDSYMDSLSPFLFPHYSELHILDLRYYRSSLREYLDSHEIDEILICYNLNNFCQDSNLFLMDN